jgi:hypothetical protein
VLLAMPAVWLAWSMLLFLAAILSIVWHFPTPQTNNVNDATTSNDARRHTRETLIARIAVTCIFMLGLVYFALILVTLRRYSGEKRGRQIRMGARTLATTAPVPRAPERGRAGYADVSAVTNILRAGSADTEKAPYVDLGCARASRCVTRSAVSPLKGQLGLGISGLEQCVGIGGANVEDGALDAIVTEAEYHH